MRDWGAICSDRVTSRMPRCIVVFTLLAVLGRTGAGRAPYRATWWDAASVVTAVGFGLIPEAAGFPHGLPSCAPCDPASLPGIDRAALHTFSGGASTASTALLGGVVGFAGLVALDGGRARRGLRARQPAVVSVGPRGGRLRGGDVLPRDGAARGPAAPQPQRRAALHRRGGRRSAARGRGETFSHGCRRRGGARRRDRLARGARPSHGAVKRTRNGERGARNMRACLEPHFRVSRSAFRVWSL